MYQYVYVTHQAIVFIWLEANHHKQTEIVNFD